LVFFSFSFFLLILPFFENISPSFLTRSLMIFDQVIQPSLSIFELHTFFLFFLSFLQSFDVQNNKTRLEKKKKKNLMSQTH